MFHKSPSFRQGLPDPLEREANPEHRDEKNSYVDTDRAIKRSYFILEGRWIVSPATMNAPSPR